MHHLLALKHQALVSFNPILLLILLPWLLVACVNESSDSPVSVTETSSSPGTLLRSSDFASSDNCPNGGILIEIGLDSNQDGTLDESEVQQRQEVCHGSAGANGSDGANGLDGIDGSDGAEGATGLISLIELTAEPPGAQCTYGGTRIDSGVDENSNGVLDNDDVNDEIAFTEYVCETQSCVWTDNGDGTTTVTCLDGTEQLVLNPEALEFTARTSCAVSIANPDPDKGAIPMIYTIDAIGDQLKFAVLTILDGQRQNTHSRLLTSTHSAFQYALINLYFDNLGGANGGYYVAAIDESSNVAEFTYVDIDLEDGSITQSFRAFDSDAGNGICSKTLVSN